MRVIVAGAGAVGLCVAEALSARGAEVVVLEAGRVGGGASAGNAGWITPSLSIPVPAPGVLSTSVRWLGSGSSPLWIRPTVEPAMIEWVLRFILNCRRDVYRRGLGALQALAAGAGPAFDRLAERGVDLERHDEPLLYPAFAPGELAVLRQVAGELRAAGGASAMHELSPGDLQQLEPTLDGSAIGGMLASDEGRVRPERLTAALAQLLRGRRVEVLEGAPVTELIRDGSTWRARTASAEHRGDAVVLANGVGATRLLTRLGVHLPLVNAKGYSRTFPCPPGEHRSPRRALYLEGPKVAISAFDGSVRISGTLELGARRLSLSPTRLHAITEAARRALPGWTMPDQAADWAGMRTLSPDGLPYIGPVPGTAGIHVATGHATLGITLAPLTGELLADLLLDGRDSPARRAVDPGRATRRTVLAHRR
ncbi:MAG: FAD-dependent oxidoreductase [Solirubrobacteraceae bacterium]